MNALLLPGVRPLLVPLAALLLGACHHTAASKLSPAKTPVASAPTPPAVMKRQILNAVDAGDGDLTVRDLRDAIAREPDRLDLRLALVDHFAKVGEAELVAEHLRLLLERFPADADLGLRLARQLRAHGSRHEALRILRNLTARQAVDSPSVWSLAGILLDELDRPMEGEAEHRRALALAQERQENIDIYENNLGFNLLAQGRRDEAVALFQAALAKRPRSEVARNNLATALAARREGDIDKPSVLAHWMSVTDAASAHNNLAAVLIEQGRYDEARGELEQSLQLRFDLPEAWKNLQLLSELDGKPVSVARPTPPAASPSGWQKVWRGVRSTFVAEEPVLKPDRSTRSASR